MRTWVGLLGLAAICVGCENAATVPEKGEVAVAMPNTLVSPQGLMGSTPVAPDANSTVIYLGKSPDFCIQIGNGKDRGLLVHEFFRQALLLAAREELGLATRDEWLGDAMPGDGPIRPFELSVQTGAVGRAEVLRGFAPAMKVVGSVEMPGYSPEEYGKRLFTAAEKLSRTSFLEILKREYGERRPHAWNADLTVPAEVDSLLREMSFLSQFKAVRQLHERTASQGESPAVLGALVRGYANLGVLTECHWHPAHKVFKARAILYAQRWLSREPSSVAAQWHRAYALTLTGLHMDAMADLTAAQESWQAMPEKARPQRPAWVALLGACCRYEIDKLAAELDGTEHGQLAALLHYQTVELAGNQRWALQTALATVEKIPECYRVRDAVCNFGGVAVAHEATQAPFRILGQTLYDRVRKMPGLPESVREHAKRPAGRGTIVSLLFGSGGSEGSVAEELATRGRLIAALREASKPRIASQPDTESAAGDREPAGPKAESAELPSDAGEPSWAALAQLIQDISFLHVWRRAYFLRYVFGDSPDGLLQQAAPLFADYPLRPFLEALTWDVAKQRAAFADVAKQPPEGMEFHAYQMMTGYRDAQPQADHLLIQHMYAHSDDIARDFVVICRLFYNKPPALKGYAKNLLEISPHSPLARSFLLDAGAATKSDVAEWEKLAPKYPALAFSLADYYSQAKQWDDAIRCGQMVAKMVADRGVYEFLADVHLEKKDEDGWLKTLEAALKLPDFGLDHSEINRKIAEHFMFKKQWQRALPYAKAASHSYSASGLGCAARCYEGSQEWDQAEQLFAAMGRRYRSSAAEWYYFCRRTGKGNLRAAREMAASYLDDSSAHAAGDIRLTAVMFYLLDKQNDKALVIYRRYFAELADPFYGLWVAILADELKAPQERDAALARVRKQGPFAVRKDVGRVRRELIQLAAWIERDLAEGGKGKIDVNDMQDLLTPIRNTFDASYVRMFLARYLESHGSRDDAVAQWKACLASPYPNELPLSLAGAALNDLGVKAEGRRQPPSQDRPTNGKAATTAGKAEPTAGNVAADKKDAQDAAPPAKNGRPKKEARADKNAASKTDAKPSAP